MEVEDRWMSKRSGRRRREEDKNKGASREEGRPGKGMTSDTDLLLELCGGLGSSGNGNGRKDDALWVRRGSGRWRLDCDSRGRGYEGRWGGGVCLWG